MTPAARFAMAWVCLAGASGALGGCGHARTVEPPTPPAKVATKEAPSEGPSSVTSHHDAVPGHPGSGSDSVELVTSPAGLLTPGAVRAIQERLVRSGDLEGKPSGAIDADTRKAIERFQRAHGLAATGIPDDATVAKLGLKTADVFRTANAQSP